ncbi:hypothetical protein HKX48_002818, partial [Thoreauomyces humboldtii]
YATWCGACQRFKQDYETLSRIVAADLPHIQVARLDIDKNPSVSSRFMVQKLPSIFHIKDKEVREITVRRASNVFTEYLKEEQWRDTEPWGPYMSPFALGPRVLGHIGTFGGKVTEIAGLFKDLPVWAQGSIGAAILLGIFILGKVLAPSDDFTHARAVKASEARNPDGKKRK